MRLVMAYLLLQKCCALLGLIQNFALSFEFKGIKIRSTFGFRLRNLQMVLAKQLQFVFHSLFKKLFCYHICLVSIDYKRRHGLKYFFIELKLCVSFSFICLKYLKLSIYNLYLLSVWPGDSKKNFYCLVQVSKT